MTNPPQPASEPSSLPEACNQTLLTWSDVSQGIDRLLGLACRQFDVFDQDLSMQGWESKSRIELLEHALIEHRLLNVRIAVLDLRHTERNLARLSRMLRYRGHQIAILRLDHTPALGHPFIVVDRQHGLKRTEMVQSTGQLWIDDPYKSKTYNEIFEEIWNSGGQRFFPESLGL